MQFPQSMSRRSPAMRFALLTAVVAIGAPAGGKKGDQTQNQTQAAPPAPPAPPAASGAAATTGPVVEVKMTGNGSTKAGFEPSSMTIPSGATVRFTNVAGGPHNITFLAHSLPAGGAAAPNAAMKNTGGKLCRPLLTQPDEVD